MKPSDVRPNHLARAMRLHETELWDHSRDSEQLYKKPRTVTIGKKNRLIDPPTYRGKQLLRLLHRFIQKHLPAHGCVHGGAKGRSCFSAASLHRGRRFVITRDISECYPSITPNSLFNRLCAIGFRFDVGTILTGLLTVRGRVPQGSPASANALNFYLFDADRSLSAAFGSMGALITRTYDDIVVSTDNPRHVSKIESLVEQQIEVHDLKVNVRKRDKNGLRRNNQLQLVHNIQVNSSRGLRIQNEQVHEALGIANGYVGGARSLSPESMVGLAHRRQRLHGWIHHCRQADFGPAQHLSRLLQQGDRLVLDCLRKYGLKVPKGKWWVIAGHRNEPAWLAYLWKRACVA